MHILFHKLVRNQQLRCALDQLRELFEGDLHAERLGRVEEDAFAVRQKVLERHRALLHRLIAKARRAHTSPAFEAPPTE